jgi:hypothetical protein
MRALGTRRRIGLIVAALAVLAAFASVAYAAKLSNNTKTLPSANPRGTVENGVSRAIAMRLSPAQIAGGQATISWGDPETTGGGTVTISRYRTKGYDGYVTVRVKSTVGTSLVGCMATLSGGDFGAAMIRSTSCTSKSYTVNLVFPGQQGRNPSLNMKWYLGIG